jgi:lysophospholipase L1-like esterase
MKTFFKKLYPFLIIILLILSLELLLRIIDLKTNFLPPATPSWVKFSPTLHYEIQPHFKGEIYYTPVEINSYGLRGADFSTDKSDTFRIVCLGNSCTFGNTLQFKDTYPYRLEKLLRSEYGNKIQVINAGIPGYSSYQGLRYLEEKAIAWKPDLLIVSFGFNDRRTVPDSSWKDGEEFFRRDSQAHLRLKFLQNSYILCFILNLFPATKNPPAINRYQVRVDSAEFAGNLKKIAQITSDQQIPIIFIGIPDNPRVLKSYLLSQKLLEAGDYLSARRCLEQSQEFYSRLTRWRFNLRIAQEGLNIAPLPEYPDVMTFHGGLPVYTSEEYNRITAQVANELGIVYIDLEKEVKSEYYTDFVHFNPRGTEMLAEELFNIIKMRYYSK